MLVQEPHAGSPGLSSRIQQAHFASPLCETFELLFPEGLTFQGTASLYLLVFHGAT